MYVKAYSVGNLLFPPSTLWSWEWCSSCWAWQYLHQLTHSLAQNSISIKKNTDYLLPRCGAGSRAPCRHGVKCLGRNALPWVLPDVQVEQNILTLGRQIHEVG